MMEEQEPEEVKDKRLWFPRGDGLGWTLNFDNKWSYAVILGFIVLIVGGIYWASIQKA